MKESGKSRERPARGAEAPALDVVVPVYDEDPSVVAQTIAAIDAALDGRWTYRVVIVDDGSPRPVAPLSSWGPHVTLVRHPKNQGYGRALKTGIEKGAAPWIAIVDADGSYPVGDIRLLVQKMSCCDMAVGARTGPVVMETPARAAVKRLFNRAASLVAGVPVRDLNSGMRVFSRDLCESVWSKLPDGFSFTSTITMWAILGGWRMETIPINYYRRVGESSLNPVRAAISMSLLLARLACARRVRK